MQRKGNALLESMVSAKKQLVLRAHPSRRLNFAKNQRKETPFVYSIQLAKRQAQNVLELLRIFVIGYTTAFGQLLARLELASCRILWAARLIWINRMSTTIAMLMETNARALSLQVSFRLIACQLRSECITGRELLVLRACWVPRTRLTHPTRRTLQVLIQAQWTKWDRYN